MFVIRSFIVIFISTLVIACNGEHDAGDNEQERSVSSVISQTQSHVGEWAVVPQPDISKQPITLRVANVVNPRFKKLSDQRLQQILMRTRELVKQHFDIEVDFSEIKTHDIAEIFQLLKADVIEQRKDEIVDINFISAEIREAMQLAIFNTLSTYDDNRQAVIDYAQPYLLHPEDKQTDFIGLSYALVDTLIARLGYWQNKLADDGKPILSDDYHQWVWWDSLGYGDLEYDILVTNQLVASAENYGMDVHSSIRGGITAGTTSYSRDGLLSGYVYIMVYPMLNDTELLTKLRDDKTYSEEQIINYSAALLTHELGHLLLHLGHPFGEKNCIMSPTTLLNYRQWFDDLNPELCALGDNEAMKPGAINLEYNKSW